MTTKPAVRTLFIRTLAAVAAIMLAGMTAVWGANAKKQDKKADKAAFTVVIDPGHGGKDAGCVGKSAREKDINLAVALYLQELIDKEMDDVKALLTRSTDKYLTLQRRADIANDAKADLFISIHVNSVDRKARNRSRLSGASVYTVGTHKEQSTLAVAMRENAVIELEEDYSTKYSGFDPQSTESYIIFELSNDMHRRQSLDFAQLACREMVTTAGRADKGVRQAGFWVLWATSMPSVLVELDFICNPAHEQFLASEDGQRKCAQALFNALSSYRKTHK